MRYKVNIDTYDGISTTLKYDDLADAYMVFDDYSSDPNTQYIEICDTFRDLILTSKGAHYYESERT